MRDSDRWVTPRVVAVGIAGVVVIVLATIAAVTYLSARGVDPAPMLKLAGIAASGLSGVASLVLQLAQRRTVAKVERNTGHLARAVDDVASSTSYSVGVVVDQVDEVDEVDEEPTGYMRRADAWETAYLPPVPPDTRRPRRRQGGDRPGQE